MGLVWMLEGRHVTMLSSQSAVIKPSHPTGDENREVY
jgi:hypothetical protein